MIDFITRTIEQLGYVGVALLMFIETLIPPIPSELIMPLVGVAAARGEMSLAGATFAAILGATAGATAWYAAARAFGPDRLRHLAERHGRFFGLAAKVVDKPAAWFARYGGWTIFVARILPGMRVHISIPAGLAGMPLGRFLMFTVAGFSVWYGLLGVVGYTLGLNVELIVKLIASAAPWLWAGFALVVGWRLLAARRSRIAA